MQKSSILLVAIVAITLTGCGSKTDASKKNFSAALNQYFDKQGDLCLRAEKWPVKVDSMDMIFEKSFSNGTANKMTALEAVGLVKEIDVDNAQGNNNKPKGGDSKVKQYELTDAAKKFYQEKVVNDGIGEEDRVEGKLCWGKRALDKVIKWEGPMEFFGHKGARVVYTYKIDNLADWAKNPAIQAAYPDVKSTLKGVGKEEDHDLGLTSEGWEAAGLDSNW
jgi:hypothetical protein